MLSRNLNATHEGQSLKAFLFEELLHLELTNEKHCWVNISFESQDPALSQSQYIVFMPCETNPLNDQQPSLRTALQSFKRFYGQGQKGNKHELIIPLYLSEAKRWVLLHISPALKNGRQATLRGAKLSSRYRGLSDCHTENLFIEKALNDYLEISPNKIKQKEDDAISDLLFLQAALRDIFLDISHTENRTKEKTQLNKVQTSGFWQRHRALIIALATVPIGIGVLALIAFGTRKLYRTIRSRLRTKASKNSPDLLRETAPKKQVNPLMHQQSLNPALDRDEDTTSESDEETLSYLQTADTQSLDRKSPSYICKLKACINDAALKSKGSGLFSGCIPKPLRQMQKMISQNLVIYDIEIMDKFSKIASKALEAQNNYTLKQIELFKQMAAWRRCESLDELRKSVDTLFASLEPNTGELDSTFPVAKLL